MNFQLTISSMSWLWKQGSLIAKDVKQTVRRLSNKEFSASEMTAQLEQEAPRAAAGDLAIVEAWIHGLTAGADEAERFEDAGNLSTFRQIFFASRTLEIFIVEKAKQKKSAKNLENFQNFLAICFVSDWQALILPFLDLEISSPAILKALEDIVTALKPSSAVETLEDTITLMGLEIQTSTGALRLAELEVARAEAAVALADARRGAAVSKSKILQEISRQDLKNAENNLSADAKKISENLEDLRKSAESVSAEGESQLASLQPTWKFLEEEISSKSKEAAGAKARIVDAEKRLAAASEEKSATKRKISAEREILGSKERELTQKKEEISRSLEALAERRQLLMNTRASTLAATDILRSQIPARISRSAELAAEALREYLALMVREFIDEDVGIAHPDSSFDFSENFRKFLEESEPYLNPGSLELANKLTQQFKI